MGYICMMLTLYTEDLGVFKQENSRDEPHKVYKVNDYVCRKMHLVVAHMSVETASSYDTNSYNLDLHKYV